jgi:hypothetical protein
MARIRTIKPEFWKHEELSELPEATHMLAAALLNYSDDYGYFNANPKLIQAECSPLREPSVSIPESLRSLQTIGYISVGKGADGKMYGRVNRFSDHQRVSHPSNSKIQDISITWEDSGNPPEILRNPPETLRPERNREQGTGKGREIPDDFTLTDDLITYAEKKGIRNRKALENFTEGFVLSCKSKKYKYVDFAATWKNWLRDEISKGNIQPDPVITEGDY